jgi:hypothetical protein
MAGFTIGEFPVSGPRADDFLLTLGRAVHIATLFEYKSRELVVQLRSTEGMGLISVEAEDLDDLLGITAKNEPSADSHDLEKWSLQEAAARAKTAKQPLAHVLERLYDEVYADPHGIEKLKEARKGRNWIAHAAGLVFLPALSSESENFFRNFRNAVLLTAHADALVSALTWVEPECWHSVGPPREYVQIYPELVVTWVFEKIWDLIPMDDLPNWQPHPGGPHQRFREYMAEKF